MPTHTPASEEAIIESIRAAAEKIVIPDEEEGSLKWVKLAVIQGSFPEEENLLERLQQLVANGLLAASFEWGDFTPEGIRRFNTKARSDFLVGYRKDKKVFRVL